MTNQITHSEYKGSFTADGKEWKAHIVSEGKGKNCAAFAIVAAADQSVVYQLHPTLLDENGGLETFKIKRIDRRGESSFALPAEVPEAALNKLVELTHEGKLQGNAGYYTDASGRDTKSINFSHTIEVEGKEWNIVQFTEKGLETPIPAVVTQGAYGTELKSLVPMEIGDNGKIAESKLFNFSSGEWKEASKDSIPTRVLEELERFGNTFKHFGEQGKAFEERLDARVASILDADSVDAGLAKILQQHHEKELDTALEKRDFPTAKNAAEEVRSHREAAEKLGKPKTHLERVRFEREQQLKVAENGDIERFSR